MLQQQVQIVMSVYVAGVKCECCQDTTSDNEKETNDDRSQQTATLTSASASDALESNEAMALADSSTASTDLEQVSASPLTSLRHTSQPPATRNRLLMQLLAGSALTDAGDKTGVPTTMSQSDSIVISAQSVTAMTGSVCAVAGNELSEDLNSVNVTDLLSAAVDLLPRPSDTVVSGTSDVDDQLLMAQLEQAVMNSELSLEDLDRLLAVSSTANAVPVTTSSASMRNISTLTDGQTVAQCHSTPLGKYYFFSPTCI